MLDTNGHLEQARHNEALAEHLQGTPYPDWRATALFYAALHYVGACFASLSPPRHHVRHIDRDTAVQHDGHISAIWDDYRKLKDWSMRSRYNGEKFPEDVFEKEILPALSAVKRHLKAHMKNASI